MTGVVPVYSEGLVKEHYDGNPSLLLTLAERAVDRNLGILLHCNGDISNARHANNLDGYLHIEFSGNLLYLVIETGAKPEDGEDPDSRDRKAMHRVKELETYLFKDVQVTEIHC